MRERRRGGGVGEGGEGVPLPEEQVANASSGCHMNDLKAKALYWTLPRSTCPAPLLFLG